MARLSLRHQIEITEEKLHHLGSGRCHGGIPYGATEKDAMRFGGKTKCEFTETPSGHLLM